MLEACRHTTRESGCCGNRRHNLASIRIAATDVINRGSRGARILYQTMSVNVTTARFRRQRKENIQERNSGSTHCLSTKQVAAKLWQRNANFFVQKAYKLFLRSHCTEKKKKWRWYHSHFFFVFAWEPVTYIKTKFVCHCAHALVHMLTLTFVL